MFGRSEVLSTDLITGTEPVLIDAGLSMTTEALIDVISKTGVELEDLAYRLLSHLHLDRVGGAPALAEACPNATFVANEFLAQGVTHEEARDDFLELAAAALGEKGRY